MISQISYVVPLVFWSRERSKVLYNPRHAQTYPAPRSILKTLHSLIQSTDFDGALRLLKRTPKRGLFHGLDELGLLRLRCLIAEVYDYFGNYPKARAVISEIGPASVDELRHVRTPLSASGYALLKQRVWAVLHWGYVRYRAHDYDEARDLFELSKRILEEHVTTRWEPCLFTWSRVWYALGLVDRQSYNYEKAKHAFVKSIDYAWRDLERRRRTFKKNSPKYIDAGTLTNYCVAKSLGLGLAWIYYTEFSPDIARPLIIAAKSLLTSTRDRVITAYINVIYAGIQRSAHADDLNQLEEAIALLSESRSTFSANKGNAAHKGYKMRAANELALAYLQGYQCGSWKKPSALHQAERYANEVEQLSAPDNDTRWLCNSLIIKSRIYRNRGQIEKAIVAADSVLAKGSKQVFLKIDAWIARGEARLALKPADCVGALKDFSDALGHGVQNPKVRAVCHLHLARVKLLADIRGSRVKFGEWERLQERGNAFLRVLGSRIAKEIAEASKDFTIPFADAVKAHKLIKVKFQGWLTDWARDHKGDDKNAASALGIGLARFYAWRRAAGLPKKRRSNKPAQMS